MAIEQIQVRRDTAANWALANPVLGSGEPAYETDTGVLKLGNGGTPYNSLPPYVSKAVSDTLYKQFGTVDPTVTVTVEHKTQSPIGYFYAVIRARTGGTATAPRFVPGLADKRYGNDFDITNPTAVGTAFKPVGERLDSYARRTGATVVTNASGWNVTSNVNEMRGAQIRNGKIFHDFEATDLTGSPAGVEAIGVLASGQMKCYSALRGDTAASMVLEGVVNSWSYGPNLVINGAGVDLSAANWQYFNTSASARTIIGQAQNGDLVVVLVQGISAESTASNPTNGIRGNDMVALAVAEGCYNASLFDGGGSTQAYTQGIYPMPSSDNSTGYDGTLGRRKVGDVFMFSGALGTAATDTQWQPLPLRSGFVPLDANNTPMIRQLNGEIKMTGAIKPSSGNFPTTDVLVADLPLFFRFRSPAAKSWNCPGNGALTRKVAINTDFSINVVGTTTTPSYIALDSISYSADTI